MVFPNTLQCKRGLDLCSSSLRCTQCVQDRLSVHLPLIPTSSFFLPASYDRFCGVEILILESNYVRLLISAYLTLLATTWYWYLPMAQNASRAHSSIVDVSNSISLLGFNFLVITYQIYSAQIVTHVNILFSKCTDGVVLVVDQAKPRI